MRQEQLRGRGLALRKSTPRCVARVDRVIEVHHTLLSDLSGEAPCSRQIARSDTTGRTPIGSYGAIDSQRRMPGLTPRLVADREQPPRFGDAFESVLAAIIER